MKISELQPKSPLFEAISVSNLSTVIDQSISDAITGTVEEAFKQLKASNTPIIHHDSFTKLNQEINNKFEYLLTTYLRDRLNQELKKEIDWKNIENPIARISFIEMQDQGNVVQDFMYINEKYLALLGRYLPDTIMRFLIDNSFLDSLNPEDKDLSDEQKSRPYDYQRLYIDDAIRLFNREPKLFAEKIITTSSARGFKKTVLHELTHILQYHKQKHRERIEYRSYLEKNKKMRSRLQQLVGSGDRGDEFFRLWTTSPQEIAAMVPEIVISLIEWIDDGLPLNAENIDFLVMDKLGRIIDQIDDKRIRKKVINRVKKLVYQEVQRVFAKRRSQQ